ncbi:MAG: hypothetical protein D4S01_07860, partial [Dehalococcoidia bacterium]
TCNTPKPLSEFHKDSTKSRGHDPRCKECRSKYARGPAGKASQYKYAHSIKGQTTKSNYRKTERCQKMQVISVKKHQRKNPKAHKVRTYLSNAIKAGKLPKASTLKCTYCSEPAKDWHHYNGYGEGHELEVIPLCRLCHAQVHAS